MPLGPWERIIVLVILVVIFGAGRLSEVGGALGKSVREFRASSHGDAHGPSSPRLADIIIAADGVNCSSCGFSIGSGKAFCGQCGTRLADA
jgi:sec-independent protein translocase protein TatA